MSVGGVVQRCYEWLADCAGRVCSCDSVAGGSSASAIIWPWVQDAGDVTSSCGGPQPCDSRGVAEVHGVGFAGDCTRPTPTLLGEAGEQVAISGGERGPELAVLARKVLTAAGGLTFEVTSLSAVPKVREVSAFDATQTGLDLSNVDVEGLEQYDRVVRPQMTDTISLGGDLTQLVQNFGN